MGYHSNLYLDYTAEDARQDAADGLPPLQFPRTPVLEATKRGAYTSRAAAVEAAKAASTLDWFVVIGYADGSWDWSQPGKAAAMPDAADSQFSYHRSHYTDRWHVTTRYYGR